MCMQKYVRDNVDMKFCQSYKVMPLFLHTLFSSKKMEYNEETTSG